MMTVMRMLPLFAIIFVIGAAEIREPGLRAYCRHTNLDSGLMKAEDRVKGENCVQKFPFKMDSSEAAAVCRYMAPFTVVKTETGANDVTCHWKSSTACKEPTDVLIKGRCFFLGPKGRTIKCPRGQLHRVVNSEEARWVSMLIPSIYPVLVRNTRQNTHISMIEDKMWDGDEFQLNGDHSLPLALNMRRNDLSNVAPGVMVGVSPSVERELYPLCSTPAVVYKVAGGSSANPSDIVAEYPSDVKNRIVVVDKSVAVRTDSVYQPSADSETSIDTKRFHDICAKRCEGCYAALPDMTAALKKGISYTTARHSPASKIKFSSTCNKKQLSINALLGRFQAQSKSGDPSSINKSSWQPSHPKGECSDSARTAVVAHSDGKLRDVPAAARHPIVCVQGEDPSVVPFSLCGKHSTEQSDGSCKCNPTFVDILTTKLKEKSSFQPGEMCISERPCENVNVPVVIIFILDTSGSLERRGYASLVKFVKDAAYKVPRHADIGFIQFGTGIHSWNWLRKGWTPREFVNSVPSRWMDGWTFPTDGINKAYEMMLEKRHINRKMVVFLTDGEASHKNQLRNAVNWLARTKTKLIVVPIGQALNAGHKAWLRSLVEDPQDYLDLTMALDKLDSNYMSNLMEVACAVPSWEDFEAAYND